MLVSLLLTPLTSAKRQSVSLDANGPTSEEASWVRGDDVCAQHTLDDP